MSDQQPEPIEQLRSKASSLNSSLDSVRRKASMADVLAATAAIDSQVGSLSRDLAQLRSRGFVFKSFLDADVVALQNEWPVTRPRVQIDADYQRRLLSAQVDDLQARFVGARSLIESDMGQADAALSAVQTAVQSLVQSADSAISSMQAMYSSLQSRLSATQSTMSKAAKTLDQIDQATFKLYPDENVIDAIGAQWLTDQKGGPKGVLFCTDHRLIFEQKEEVATKKMLFIVTEKQKVQQLALEAPIGSAQEVKESESGALIFRKDHLEMTFGGAAKVRSAHFILQGDSAEWQKLINRVNSGDIDKERVKAENAPAPEAKPRAMPTQCPACGARITQTLVRGMESVKCQYCGTVISLQ